MKTTQKLKMLAMLLTTVFVAFMAGVYCATAFIANQLVTR